MFFRNRVCISFFIFLCTLSLGLAQARPRITVESAEREINSRVLRLGDVIAEDPHKKSGIGSWSRSSYVFDPDFFVGDASASQDSNIELMDEDRTLIVTGNGHALTTVELQRPYYGRGIQAFSTLETSFTATHPVIINFDGYLQSLYVHWNGFSFASFTLIGPDGFRTIRYEAGVGAEEVPFSGCCLEGPPGTYSLSLYAVSYCDYYVDPKQFYNWISNYWELDFSVSTGGTPADGGA